MSYYRTLLCRELNERGNALVVASTRAAGWVTFYAAVARLAEPCRDLDEAATDLQ